MASTPVPDMPYMHLVESTGEVKFSSPEVDVPLYIKALQSLIVKFTNTYEYSKDNVTWTSATSSTSISAKAGERVFFRASGLTASSSKGIGTFTISNGDCNVGGNIMSMVYGADFKGKTEITQTYQFKMLFYSYSYQGDYNDAMRIVDASGLALPATTLANYCYQYMFQNQQKLTNAPALPATTLATYCYQYMFSGCSSLVNAPALPATTLATYCYSYMFNYCTSLVNAPALPATTLANYCYQYMFSDCSSLVNAPALPATTLATYCYQSMFRGCTSLVNAPALPATTLASYCYSYMFSNCSSLVNAHALPATTLASSCYLCMFNYCTSLVNAPALPATTLANYCYQYMFSDCSSLVNAPALPATTLATYCYQYMFRGCTSLVNAPALPATHAESSCYSYMFRDCTSLVNAPEMPLTNFYGASGLVGMFYGCSNLSYINFSTVTYNFANSTYFTNWVYGVSPTGTFVKNSAATWENTFGVSAIPEGWTVELADA